MPITGKIRVSKDLIFSRIGEEQVYRYYMGRDFKIGSSTHSPLHKDDNPSFSIFLNEEGEYRHTDFATGDSGSCIDLVMQLFGLSFYEALKKINDDFGLSISALDNRKEYQRLVNEATHTPRKETLIQVTTGRWKSDELAYWNMYHIDREELKSNFVYPIRKLFLNREAYLLPVGELVFGYLYGDKWKIYRPYADKKHKWMTNVPLDHISGLNRVKEGSNRCIITKSKKDEIILAKFLPVVCSVQNESKFCLTQENMTLLQANSKDNYINFDSDEVGVKASRYYNQFGFKWINCPAIYSPIKDFADLAKEKGLEEVINYFKSKNLV